jgi:hypothetical protein
MPHTVGWSSKYVFLLFFMRASLTNFLHTVRRTAHTIARLLVFSLIAAQHLVHAESITLPISQTVLRDGLIRYSVPISVDGGPSIDAMLDTGSVGLRVLAMPYKDNASGVVTAQNNLSTTGSISQYSYRSGVTLNGVNTHAGVKIGRVGDISFQLVTQVSCLPLYPQCPASGIAPIDYRISSNGFVQTGFTAILGIGATSLESRDLPNPLAMLGYRSWTVELPFPGTSTPGSLTLSTVETPMTGFTPLVSDVLGRVPGCIILADRRTVCAQTLLDTGAPGVDVYTPEVAEPRVWRTGIRSAFCFANTDLPSAEFISGARGTFTHVTLRPLQGRQQTVIASGVLPYFRYIVLYDAQGRVAGARLR